MCLSSPGSAVLHLLDATIANVRSPQKSGCPAMIQGQTCASPGSMSRATAIHSAVALWIIRFPMLQRLPESLSCVGQT